MKKNLFGLAILSLVFAATSCANESGERANDGQNAISFQPYIGKQVQSRAVETGLAGLKTAAASSADGIAVEAFFATNANNGGSAIASKFSDFSIYWAPGTEKWTYVPLQFWPNDELKYYAWHPKGAITLTAPTPAFAAEASFVYTVEAVADQVDLIAASALATTKDVELKFNHLLSQINFAVQETDQFRVEIKSITLTGINNEATYTYNTTDGTVGDWTAHAGAVPYALAYAGTDTAFPITDVESSEIVILSSSADKNALMLMPQDFTVNTTAKIVVEFNLFVKNGDFGETFTPVDANGNYYYTYTGTNDVPANVTFTADLGNFLTTAWESGKRYTYLMDFTNYLADKTINFTVVELDNWENWNEDTDDSSIIAVEVAVADVSSIYGAINSLRAYLNNVTTDAIQITVNGDVTANLGNIEIPDDWFDLGATIIIDFQGTVDATGNVTIVPKTGETPVTPYEWVKTGVAGAKTYTFVKTAL